MISQETIQEVTRRIVEYLQPEKVVLFGSYAIGNPNEESDLDFLVIKDTDVPQGRRRGNLNEKLRGLRIPVDVFVFTPDEVEYWKNTKAAFVTQALKEGREVYGK